MRVLVVFLLLFSAAIAMAEGCNLIVPSTSGGYLDYHARQLQLNNKDIIVSYKPGMYNSSAIEFILENPDYAIVGAPYMYSTKNPNPKLAELVEVVDVFVGSDQVIITNSGIDFKNLLTDTVNIGVPLLGSAGHILAAQIMELNPNAQVISFGGDARALASVKNKEIHAYISSTPPLLGWVDDFGFRKILQIQPNETIKKDGVSLTNISMTGIIISKKATAPQREKILACIKSATSQQRWKDAMKTANIKILNFSDAEKNKMINLYIAILKKYSL